MYKVPLHQASFFPLFPMKIKGFSQMDYIFSSLVKPILVEIYLGKYLRKADQFDCAESVTSYKIRASV